MPELEFFNGLGGFASGGKEYVTILGPGQSTPAPWINVIANATFGFQTSTEGGGYTWSANSRENQLTPWSNDPVSDPQGEVFYLRDDRDQRRLEPDGASHPRRLGSLCRLSRAGLQPLRAHYAWHRRQPPSVRARRRINQDIAPAVDQQIKPDPLSQRDRLCRMGARPVESRIARIYRNRDRRHDRRNLCAQSLRIRLSARASLSPTCGAPRAIGRATGASS